MAELAAISRQNGEVLLAEELVEFLSNDAIDAAIEQLRFSGGHCWSSHGKIHHSGDVSLIVHKTPAGGKVGALHFRCGPPQIIDSGRNRRATIAFDRYIQDRSHGATAPKPPLT